MSNAFWTHSGQLKNECILKHSAAEMTPIPSNCSCGLRATWWRVEVKAGCCVCASAEIQSCLVSSGDVGCGTFHCFANNSCEIHGLHHICLTLLHNAGRYDSQVGLASCFFLHTLGRDRRAACLASSTSRWVVSNLKQADMRNIWMCFLFIWIPSVIWEECLLYKEQHGYRTGREGTACLFHQNRCAWEGYVSPVCVQHRWTHWLMFCLWQWTEVPHVSDLAWQDLGWWSLPLALSLPG